MSLYTQPVRPLSSLSPLRRGAAATLLLLLSSCACVFAQSPPSDPVRATGAGKVILVLPFSNRTGQPALDWIADSFPDTLNQRLASAGFFTITREDRQFALDHLGLPVDFKPSRATTIRIAQTLDAEFVIVGSYTTAGTRINVQAQVLEISALRLSPPIADSSELARLFDVENALSWSLARQLDPQLDVAQQTFLAASAGIPLSSFENYIRGIDAAAPQERIKHLSLAVQATPNYAAAALALGKAYFAERDYDRAAATLSRIPRSDRRALEAGFFIGLARFNSAKYAEAETAFAFVASRLPLPEVINNQGVAASRQGRDAAAFFQRIVTSDPTEPDFHYNLAVALLRRHDTAGAQREANACLKLRPTDTEAAQLRDAAARGDSIALPSETETAATQLAPLERIRRTYSEATFRQAAFQLEQMQAAHLATLAPAPRAEAYTQQGEAYLAQGLLPEAEQNFQQAIAADGASYAAHAGLAEVREQSGNPDDARAEAEASLHARPNVAAYLVLARIELQRNALAASADDVGHALHLDPRSTSALGMRQALVARGQSVP